VLSVTNQNGDFVIGKANPSFMAVFRRIDQLAPLDTFPQRIYSILPSNMVANPSGHASSRVGMDAEEKYKQLHESRRCCVIS
jgi:hypothetical protein